MGNNINKATIYRWLKFSIYCVAVILFSIYSSTGRTVIGGEVYTRFFPGLFILNLFAWLIIYALVRFAVWFIRVSREK